MPIFRLYPADPSDPNWEASSHRGPVIVRARDEAAARDLAQEAFGVKTGFPPGRGMRVPPWTRPQLVYAEILDDAGWPTEGADEILVPTYPEEA